MDVLASVIVMLVLLAAAPVGAWYTHRHPAVRNDAWGGTLGFFLSWPGFLVAIAFCAWRKSKLDKRSAAPAA
ncbi:hypothetical protein DJ010_10060 [Nocardioides silvaticus]|uniref:Uncharacterized protein n=1 Tax=Nocardioides silvaticus TaxID=2201891 RepID=A0A316TED4_9ACTN|nr:hypothetical protein [Nocardioides silvaticus]PWN02757.1 hypothetical protein DJ010_10060 [Nocardioides silvaticus]